MAENESKVLLIKSIFNRTDTWVGKVSFIRKFFIFCDFLWERNVHGTSRDDYFQYEFFNYKRNYRRSFINNGRRRYIGENCNNEEESKILKDKGKFIEYFQEFLGRDSLNMEIASKTDFEKFLAKHTRIFVKPIRGTFGMGTEILDCGSEIDCDALYNKYAGKELLFEEVIEQHPVIAQFNESSLNTLRVLTFHCADDTVKVMPGCVIRVGRKGKIADNFHHYGIGMQIDVETGLTCSPGVDKLGRRYVTHPDSGVTLLGVQIPCWDKVCDTVKKAAMICPNVRYVGWDVAVTKDGRVVIVEGNDRADPDVSQMSDRIGKWPEYKPYVEEVIRLKK